MGSYFVLDLGFVSHRPALVEQRRISVTHMSRAFEQNVAAVCAQTAFCVVLHILRQHEVVFRLKVNAGQRSVF